MIANQSTVASLGDAESYLRVGHRGKEVDEAKRVDWSTTRNLPTEDTQLAKTYMEATAELRDHRVEAPFYSMSVSFPTEDAAKVDRALMEKAADRVLNDLGLGEHEAIIVAHKDKDHPHFHILANRIHPEDGRAWATWNDYQKTDKTLRAFERENGLTQVSTWKVEPEQQKELPSLPRKSQVDFVEHLRGTEVPDALKAAKSWAELEDRLAAHGLVLQRSGRGLQLTDGEKVAKISALHRKSSLKNLESRFGETWKEWAARSPETAYEPNTQRGRSAPDPKILARVERVEPLVRIETDNDSVARMVKGLEQDTAALEKQRRQLDDERHKVDRQIRSTLDAVKPAHRPDVDQLQPTPTAPAGATNKQTNAPSPLDQQTSRHSKQTRLNPEDGRLIAKVENADVSVLRTEIPKYREFLKKPPPSKGPTLEEFRRHVAKVIQEEQLRGKQRFLGGANKERQGARAKIDPLPELLHKRRQLDDQYKTVDRNYVRTVNFRMRIAEKRKDPPSPTQIYTATRGIPGKQIEALQPSIQTQTRKVRAGTVQIWNTASRHLANQGAELLLPQGLKRAARIVMAKDTGRALGAQASSAAIGKLPKTIRPVAQIATGKTAALTAEVLGRLLPPQAQIAMKVIQTAALLVKASYKAIQMTRSRSRDQGIER